MAKDASSVVGLHGRTVDQIFDLAQQERHQFQEIVIIGLKTDGTCSLFKTRMTLRDYCLLCKVMESEVISEMFGADAERET